MVCVGRQLEFTSFRTGRQKPPEQVPRLSSYQKCRVKKRIGAVEHRRLTMHAWRQKSGSDQKSQ